MRSEDEGRSWSEARPLGHERGRIFDAIVVDGKVLTLSLANDSSLKFVGHLPEHHYSLWVSGDHGRTFERRSILPLEMVAHFYGTLTVLPDGALAAYIYDERDEFHLVTLLSRDGGRSWEPPLQTNFAKRIRNQKIAAFRGGYIMHGRTGSMGDSPALGHLVLYTSSDGLQWDDGRILEERLPGTIKYSGAYSNSLVVHDPEGVRPPNLLIQSSHAYRACMTNIRHRWLK